jgi:hypothetical protein
MVYGAGFRVWGSGFRVSGSGFRVQCVESGVYQAAPRALQSTPHRLTRRIRASGRLRGGKWPQPAAGSTFRKRLLHGQPDGPNPLYLRNS